MLEKQAGHPWATASIHFSRFKLTGDPRERLALMRLTEGKERNNRAVELSAKLEPLTP